MNLKKKIKKSVFTGPPPIALGKRECYNMPTDEKGDQ